MRGAALNLYSEADRHQAMVASAFGAVAEHFSHITVRDILNPPSKGFYDAFLARQIAWTILVRDFQIPKKRLVKVHLRSLDTLQRALRIVEERRRTCPVFSQAYGKMACRAHALLQVEFERAAA